MYIGLGLREGLGKTGRQKRTFNKNSMGRGHFFYSLYMDMSTLTLNRPRCRF